jgi:hypothetical protein
MCDDCASIAAEYEFLYGHQKHELMRAQDAIKELEREVARWKRRAEGFEHVAKLGYSEVIQGYLDSVAAQYRTQV